MTMTEERQQRTQAEVDALGAKGQAYKNADGHYSFPIVDASDLSNAIQAYGRAAASEQAGVKAYIQGRAKTLNLTSMLPDSWSSSRSRKRRADATPRRVEHRSIRNVEVRAAQDGSDTFKLTGQPIVYGDPYTVHGASGSFAETMQRGAASHLLDSDVILAWNHDTDAIPLARTGSGTLRLLDTAQGLNFEADLDPRNPAAQALRSAVERGDVSQMSIGFTVGQDSWSGAGQTRSRNISRLGSLIDISPVTWPASPGTSVSVMERALAAAPDETLADIDRIYVEVRKVEQRTGKVLSSDNEDALMTALEGVHSVLAANGFDAQAYFSGDDDTDDSVEDDNDESMDDEADENEDSGEDRSDALALELELMQLRCMV